MNDTIRIDTVALQSYLKLYKASFQRHRLGIDNEIYKWKAVKCFQDNWDIDAPDLPTMLKTSLAKTSNLLAASYFFPKSMIEDFAKADPQTLRVMFRDLFDETKDVFLRIKNFEEKAKDLLGRNPQWKGKSTYQNPNSISTYLWLRYPDKYYIYKYSIIKDNARKLCGLTIPPDSHEGLVFGYNLYDTLCEELRKDEELVTLSYQSLTDDCYPDKALKTLTIDVGYFISRQEDRPEETGKFDSMPNLSELPHRNLQKEKVMDKNIILYGPPGTGKTYSTVLYAVATIERKLLDTVKREDYRELFKRYKKYRDDGLIAFTTFHQSYGYEEFIEGIRPVLTSGEGSTDEIKYELRDGVFKAFCNNAGTPVVDGNGVDLGIGTNPTVWKVSLGGTGDNPTRTECMEHDHIRIHWDGYGETISDEEDFKDGGKPTLNAFYHRMQVGDIVMSCYSDKMIDAIGVITGDPEWHNEYPEFKRLRKVRWLVKGIKRDISKLMTPPTIKQMSISISAVLDHLRVTAPHLFKKGVSIPERIFIIDEINRGNISKIFGELITLIENDKRLGQINEIKATLPYSGQSFGVPENVHIIGTMNTADRSIALIDTALRRRFTFVEMQPDSSLLKDIKPIEGIDVAGMLDIINRRVTVLLDREHTIGHSFLMPLKDDPTLSCLAGIFQNKILPLLQEYFYDDYEKIRLVLGDNLKKDDSIQFIKKVDSSKFLIDNENGRHDYFEIYWDAFLKAEAYAHLS